MNINTNYQTKLNGNYDKQDNKIKEIKNKEIKNKETIENNLLLDNVINNFFPTNGCWYSDCFKKPKSFTKGHIVCNTNNYLWMATYLSKLYKEEAKKEENKNFPQNLSVGKIYNYIKNSENFNNLKHNYELTVVKWQIDYILDDNGGYMAGRKYKDVDCLCDCEDSDRFFYNAVLTTLTAIGMNGEVVEEGLQKNLTNYIGLMYSAYRMHNNLYLSMINEDELTHEELETYKKHKESWIKLRRNEFYNEHKKAIEKYGDDISKSFKLEKQEINELKKFVKENDSTIFKLGEKFKIYFHYRYKK